MSLGRIAYKGYLEASDGKSLISGEELPSFDQLPTDIRIAWEMAANAVAVAVRNETPRVSG